MENLAWLASTWAHEFAQVLEMMTGAQFQAVPEELQAPTADSFCWEQGFSVHATATLSLSLDEGACIELGRRTLLAAGIEPVEPAAARGTYLELLQQSLSGLSRAIATRIDGPVDCVKGRETQSPASTPLAAYRFTSEGWDLPPILLYASPSLLVGLSHIEEIAPAKTTAITSRERADVPAAINSKTIDVLMEVELPVTLSFGQARIPLKDVLKLSTGSVVELDKRTEDLVEVIVNNCVIARGDVVVVDGNYAVRLQEIVSRQQRLSLRANTRAVGH